jgi:hypothetical protein
MTMNPRLDQGLEDDESEELDLTYYSRETDLRTVMTEFMGHGYDDEMEWVSDKFERLGADLDREHLVFPTQDRAILGADGMEQLSDFFLDHGHYNVIAAFETIDDWIKTEASGRVTVTEIIATIDENRPGWRPRLNWWAVMIEFSKASDRVMFKFKFSL